MTTSSTRFWRVHCHIGQHPGQWQYWFREQCCAVGWPPPQWGALTCPDGGFRFDDPGNKDRSWSIARSALKRARAGDWVIATLPYGRAGRIGRIVEVAARDDQWDPIVRPNRSLSLGENGRRIFVRWDLTAGPDDHTKVVKLPAKILNSGELRGAIKEIPITKVEAIRAAMRDEANWVSIAGTFALETALSDYIANNPQRLEAGMIAHPWLDVRELTFGDKRRADVILEDRSGRVVIVECKQGAPTSKALLQIAHYRSELERLYPELGVPRTVVVHGGANRVLPEVAEEASGLSIELAYFELQVNFFGIRTR